MRFAMVTVLLLAAAPLLAEWPCGAAPIFFNHTLKGDIVVELSSTDFNYNQPSAITVTRDGWRIELAQSVAPHGAGATETGCSRRAANLGALPMGTYDVVWTVNGSSRTVKFVNAGAGSCGEPLQLTATVRRNMSGEYQLDVTERTRAETYDAPIFLPAGSGFVLQQTEHINVIAIIEGFGAYHCTQRTFLLGPLTGGYGIDITQFVDDYPDARTLHAGTVFFAGGEQPRRRGVRH